MALWGKRTLRYGLIISVFVIIAATTIFMSAGGVKGSAVPVSQGGGPVILANFDVPVDLGASTFMSRVVSYATSVNASAIVIVMNTPGGLGSDLLSILNSISQANSSGIPVYTYVPPNSLAASAGSYIAMACNKILMGPGGEIGPSTPIVEGGSELDQNHTESAFLQIMTSYAETWGRNTTAVYDMVIYDQAYTTDGAYSNHVIDGIANSTDQALQILGISGTPTQSMSENLYEQTLSALSNSTLDGLLLLFGFIALLIELFHPTIVVGAVGIVAIVAGLIGLETFGASILGYVLLAIAAFLILIELKLAHGFAVVAGVVVGAIGILFLSQGLTFAPAPNLSLTYVELTIFVAAGVIAGLYIRWIIGPLRRRRSMTGPESLIGKTGVAIKDLKPEGEVRVEGIVWRAKAESGEIAAGEVVRVKKIEELVLIVEKVQPPAA